MIAQPWGGRDETADADEFREVRQDHPPSAVPVGPGLDHSLAGAGSGGADGIPEESAGFFTYTDDGGIELDTEGRPEILRHKEWFEPRMEPFQDARDAYRPLVWQCRYGGIEVPDELWSEGRTGVNRHYSENQAEGLQSEGTLLPTFDAWFERFIRHVGQRGAVEPGRWRAYGKSIWDSHGIANLIQHAGWDRSGQ